MSVKRSGALRMAGLFGALILLEAHQDVCLAAEAAEPESGGARKLVVAIDPGHQGSWVNMSDTEPNAPGSSVMKAKASTGTQGRFSGVPEYELNLEISLLLRDELEARGYGVILTREDNDTAISNSERALMAYDEGGDIYVRIHANGSEDSGVNGALAMVPSEGNPYVGDLAEDSYLLADCILNAYCGKSGIGSLGIQYYDDMTGINWSRLPVMILEMGFMTNESDDLRMTDASVQPLMAEGIADGIDQYFDAKGMRTQEALDVTAQTALTEDSDAAGTSEQLEQLLDSLKRGLLAPEELGQEIWAVSVKDLKTGAVGDIGGDTPMKSASVIKAFIMATIYDRACYPSSPDRLIDMGEAYDGELRDLITRMIANSDNDAANALIEKLGGGDAAAGMEIVNQFCEENGYEHTSLGREFLEENPSGDNYTSANDCRKLLDSICSGTCVNEEASEKMYDYLLQQTRRSKIPMGISGEGVSVANKTGELYGEYGDYVENDIAIVKDGQTEYILCVLSQDLQDDGGAVSRIVGISGFVYSFLKTGMGL